ncbi:MAG TPA: OmpA family protein, partial [Cyclobacteriaceae bacterium]
DGRTFFFKLTKASNQKVVEGEVDIFDSEKQKKTASYTGNKDVFVRTTVNKSGDVLLKCEVFGYRKSELAINLNNLQTPAAVSIENDKVVVPFELVRLKKGDIAIMYNVFFYKDAAIMRPESRVEVTSLLDMMKENLKMKIRIHGHTNGSAAGKIIELGDSKNFFSLSGTKEGFGTAKKLSETRAQTISEFLASEGIDPSRMEIKAWGGKKPLLEKDHAQAHTNVRVEIELLGE